jgi:hypothetical protein
MTTFRTVYRFVTRRLAERKSLHAISKELGVSVPAVGRIAKGERPGVKVSKRLGITPICSACHRAIPKARAHRSLFDMPTKELLRRLNERY